MVDKRSQRKASVVQFLSHLDIDRLKNSASLVARAKSLKLDGFNMELWEESEWVITEGRLVKLSGKNASKVTLNFHYALPLDKGALKSEWADLVKAMIVLRFHRDNQSAPNQRNFIAAVSYVVCEMVDRGLRLYQLTPEVLDLACKSLTKNYSDGVAYNMHKAIGEFAAHCDANVLCNVLLDYKFFGMKRPENTGGIGQKRLDDQETLLTENDKLIDPKVFKIIGELYLNVPADHKYRFYVLVLSLMAMLGRRFSEIATIPKQVVSWDDQGRAFLKYFPRKVTRGDVFTPMKNHYLPTQTVPIVEPIITELNQLCAAARRTATEMQMNMGPDLFFLVDYPHDKKFYKDDLEKIGISATTLDTNGWIRENGFTFTDEEKLTSHGKVPNYLFRFTTKIGIIA
jgi:hypothetical protein